MTPELTMLALSVLLGLVQIVLSSHSKSFQYGYRWTASARDATVPPLKGLAARLERALANFLETFPFFAAAVLSAHVLQTHNGLTWWGAQLYFWARLVYLVLYALGVPLLRSLVWNVAITGILLVLAAPFLPA